MHGLGCSVCGDVLCCPYGSGDIEALFVASALIVLAVLLFLLFARLIDLVVFAAGCWAAVSRSGDGSVHYCVMSLSVVLLLFAFESVASEF